MSSPLPPNWVAYQTQDGKIFYSNSVTGESRWERPTASEELTFDDWSKTSGPTSVKVRVKEQGLLLFPFMFLTVLFGSIFIYGMGFSITWYGGQFPIYGHTLRWSYFVLFFLFSRSSFRRCSDDNQRHSSAIRMLVFITLLVFILSLTGLSIFEMSIVGLAIGYVMILLSFEYNKQSFNVSDSVRIIERLIGGLIVCFFLSLIF
jgi:hypothetical protein